MSEQITQPAHRSNVYHLTTGARNPLGTDNSDRHWFVIKVGKHHLIEQHATSSLAVTSAQLRFSVHGASAMRLS